MFNVSDCVHVVTAVTFIDWFYQARVILASTQLDIDFTATWHHEISIVELFMPNIEEEKKKV